MTSLRLAWLLLLAALTAPAGLRADEFDTLRLKWRDLLTMGTNANPADQDYAGWITGTANAAQTYWNTMRTNTGRAFLWTDLAGLTTNSGHLTGCYERLRTMALAHAIRGSAVEGNPALRGAIGEALDWLYANHYNETKEEFDNWYDWEIGAPLNLNDITVLLFTDLSAAQVANYMNAVNRFTPVPDLTGANLVWKASVVAVRGAIVRNGPKIVAARQALSDVFPDATTGDGFYPDGSFVFHDTFPYNGGYGAELIATLGPLLHWLDGSTWQVTDPARTNVFRWVPEAFAPFLYRGALMPMVDGRYHTRNGDDHAAGHTLLGSFLRLAQFAPPADAAAFKQFVKGAIQSDTSRDFLAAESPPFNVWAREVMNDPNVIALAEPVGHRQFPRMDRVVHRRPGWSFGLAMSSSRISNYESIRGENLRGWYSGDGMAYLHNGDLTQFGDGYWATVNPYRLPGVTVESQVRTNASGEGYRSPNRGTGGASVEGLYGVAGMHLNAWNSTLSARKSWFLLDNEVVCLTAGINASDGRSVETVIENRRLGVYGQNAFTVNGVAQPVNAGWAQVLADASWAHLAGSALGADVGYVFPQAPTIQALREARSGAFEEINTRYGSSRRLTRSFLTLWQDHGVNPTNGSAAWILLPNASQAQVAAYAANPDVTILENTTRAQAVRDQVLGVTAANFWRDGSNRVGGITVDRRASVIVRHDGSFLELGLSDPTQTNGGTITLELTNAVAATLWSDPGLTVLQLTPSLRLAANVAGAGGQTFRARFFAGATQTVNVRPTDDAYVQNGDQAANNFGTASTLALKASAATQGRETLLLFTVPPSTGLLVNASLRLVPITVNDPGLQHALAPVPDTSWSETTLTWNNKPVAGLEFARWALPSAGVPIVVPVTTLAQQATAGDGRMALRIASTGTPPPTNGYAAYAAKENGQSTARPQLTLTLGRVPPRIALTAPTDGAVFDSAASITARCDVEGVDGAVAGVDLFLNSSRVAGGTNIPFQWTLTQLATGAHTLTAVATAASGLSATSGPVTIRVMAPSPNGRGSGLLGQYFSDPNLTSQSLTRVDSGVNFDWGFGRAAPSLPVDRFSVRWSGKLQARRGGVHQLLTTSDEGVRLWLDGSLVIDHWANHGPAEDIGQVTLEPGRYYDLRMEYFDQTGSALAQLLWTEPGGAREIIPSTQLYPALSGLRGEYFAGTNLTNLVMARIDPAVDFAWGPSSPDPALMPGSFSARWTGRVRADQGGAHTFHVRSDDGARLWVNQQLIVNNWTVHTVRDDSGVASLVAGQWSDIVLEYFQHSGDATVALRWTPPGSAPQLIPVSSFTPAQDNRPPLLVAVADRVAPREYPVSFFVQASDPDVPGQSLRFSLEPGAPAGAVINALTGEFSWNPASHLSLGRYPVTVRVSDDGTPAMTDAQTFAITLTDLTPTVVALVSTGAVWRFLDAGLDPGSAWRSLLFNETAWRTGRAPLGYGTGAEATTVSFGANPANKPITTYFRRTFFIPDVALIRSLGVRALRNDGIAVHLNATEVCRDNLPAGSLAFGTLASGAITGAGEINVISRTLPVSALVNGTNVIAVEVHQSSSAGLDLAFDLELTTDALVPARPALEFAMVSGGVELRWPFEAGLLRLAATTNLQPPVVWNLITNSPDLDAGRWRLRLPPALMGNQFFRLQTQ